MISHDDFIDKINHYGKQLYRDFSWRRTHDPYAVLVSEVMLQQTQTARVQRYFDRWMQRFPTVDALAAASVADVLELWQGLGYNRRALALKKTADVTADQYGGILPATLEELCTLPGVGAATAAGVLAFSFNKTSVYLETNVRTVLLHEFYPNEEGISDTELRHLLEEINELVNNRAIDARSWNYALLDYGAHLKKALPNPSRRSKHHSKQSAYEGSRRQKRARLLETILATPGKNSKELASCHKYDLATTESILTDLAREGFILLDNEVWRVC